MKRGLSTNIIPAAFFAAAVVFFSISGTTAFAQTVPRKPLSEGHLEHIQDPPATIVPKKFQLSPQKISPFGPYTSYQANVDVNGNNILGDAANEPSICVDPTNPNRMAIGWRQFNSVTSNFRQAGWGFTSNGGVTWTFPGVLQNNVFRSDPVLDADASGQFFYLSLLQNFFDDLWRSPNGGAGWQILGQATGGDKQWFTIDKTNSPGRGFQYQAWSTAGNNYGGRQFSRSTDGGLTWRAPVFIPQTPIWGTLDVDSNGNLFIGGVNPNTGRIWCIRSTNAKNAAVTPSFDLTTPINLGGDIDSGEFINPEGIIGQINLAVDRSGTSTNNNVYILASVLPTGASSGTDVMFVRSTDGGQTFSAPVRVNDDPVNPNKWHWFGAMSVAPSGRIDAVWLEQRRNAVNNTNSQLFYSFSNDAGQTWSANVPVSNPFNPLIGYPNQQKMGDYITVVSDNNGANVSYSSRLSTANRTCISCTFQRPDAMSASRTLVKVRPAVGSRRTMAGPAAQAGLMRVARRFSLNRPEKEGGARSVNASTPSGAVSNWLLTPAVTLQNGGKLSFRTRSGPNSSHTDRLQVRVSLNGDSRNAGNAADEIGDFKTVLLDLNATYAPAGYPAEWTEYTATINGLTTPTTGRLAFRYLGENPVIATATSDSVGLDGVQFECTPSYVIALGGAPPTGGFLTGGGRYTSGTNVSVIATANPNFAFTNWTENGVVVSTSATYNFTAQVDRNLVANFAFVAPATAPPVILPAGGTFTKKVQFKITCPTPNAVIFYTTDGSDPTTSSAVFPHPAKKKQKVPRVKITGAGVHVVKAMAIAPGFTQSPIVSATYTIH